MTTFWTLLQTMNEEEEAALLDGGEKSKAMRVIRTGMGLRNKDCGNFWEDFISICNDGEGLAELLDIPSEKIGGWVSKIKEALDKVEDSDSQQTGDEKAKILPTGGISFDGADTAPKEPSDTRPMP